MTRKMLDEVYNTKEKKKGTKSRRRDRTDTYASTRSMVSNKSVISNMTSKSPKRLMSEQEQREAVQKQLQVKS